MSNASFCEEDQAWMQAALKLAQKAAHQNEVPVGALLVRDGQCIGRGWNQPIMKNDPSAHAEVIALREGALAIQNYRLVETTLYVTLEPCMMCAGAIIHARVKRLVFAASDPKTGACHSAAHLFDQPFLNHRVHWEGGLLASHSQILLQSFF